MSIDSHTKAARKMESLLRRPESDRMATPEVATYVTSILKGVRRLTKAADRKDLAFLDYLLATAEDEAANLASRIFH